MQPSEASGTIERDVLVIGGGIAGLTAALESADAGCSVLLIEKTPFLGGRVARMHQYFPKMCPPSCGLEMRFRQLRQHPRVQVDTLTRVESVTGAPGRYTVVLRHEPRFVTDACTACGDCTAACQTLHAADYDYGLSQKKAVRMFPGVGYPTTYAIDRVHCAEGCDLCAKACRYGAIDLHQVATTSSVRVSAVVAATGWVPFDAHRLATHGFGRCSNVVTNVMMERMAAADGPTAGRIVRPSDGAVPRTIAFAQCVGSRDDNHLPYCSAVCCAASLKQISYVRAACPDATVKVFYIDVRTPGRLESLYARFAADPSVEFVKGKVAQVEEDPETGQVIVDAEEVLGEKRRHERVDLLVLATGVVPASDALPAGYSRDQYSFVTGASGGLFAAGCVRRPADVATTVRDATGAALKALQVVARSRRHE